MLVIFLELSSVRCPVLYDITSKLCVDTQQVHMSGAR